MNKQMISYNLGRLMQVIGLLLLIPFVISLIYQEGWTHMLSFLLTAIGAFVLGYILSFKEPEDAAFYAKEGFIIVSLSWIMISLIGAIPFVINGDIPSIVDAFFETASGFTTTGASALDTIDHMAHSSIFWRSFTHLIGGMGVLVFALAILPQIGSDTVHIMKAEVPGPQFGKLVSRLSSSARILYIMYIFLTGVTVLGLLILGMPIFDALIYAFGAAGTGGFAMTDAGLGVYDSRAIEVFLSVAMLVFGVNFNLYFLIVLGQAKKIFKSEELKWYLGIVGIATLVILVDLVYRGGVLGHSFVDSLFTVSSVVTTTGYSTANFNTWPLFSRIVIILLMFIGGMAGSTAGGLKVSRIAISVKAGFAEFKRMLHPNRTVTVVFEDSYVKPGLLNSIASYIFVYGLIFIGALLLISLDAPDFLTAFSSIAATLNNIGPGLEQVGPDASFAFYHPLSKLLLTFIMIIGRLEIFPILVLFSPNTWTKIT